MLHSYVDEINGDCHIDSVILGRKFGWSFRSSAIWGCRRRFLNAADGKPLRGQRPSGLPKCSTVLKWWPTWPMWVTFWDKCQYQGIEDTRWIGQVSDQEGCSNSQRKKKWKTQNRHIQVLRHLGKFHWVNHLSLNTRPQVLSDNLVKSPKFHYFWF